MNAAPLYAGRPGEELSQGGPASGEPVGYLIKRSGEYSTHEFGITPDGYDAHLDMDFSVLGEHEAAAA